MADFRRWITALSGLALFVGMASAQVNTGGGNGAFTCNATVVPNALRAEGMTEQVGDIVLSCTGGTPIADGAQIPQANITVFLNTNVTSRLLSGSASEALLMIDEPNSGQPGFGPSLPLTLCTTPTMGCQAFVGTATNPITSATQAGAAVTTSGGTVPASNVFQGIVSGNSVTFFGVPIQPPATAGVSRVYRITNVRGNASALGGGAASGVSQAIASVSIAGPTSVLVNNSTLVVGYVQNGLSSSVRSATGGSFSTVGVQQCVSLSQSPIAVLRFSELFGTAFKSQYALVANGSAPSTAGQNVPGQIYNSESNFLLPIGSATAGFADYGTRLKAVFNNIPSGARLFVTTRNLTSSGAPFVLTASGLPAPPATASIANLVSSETISNSGGLTPVNQSSTVSEIPVVNGSATAVWEVVSTNPSTNENFDFGVEITTVANPGSNSPAVGTATVNMSFAPTPPAFSASSGVSASSTLPIPRFADTSTARNLFSVNVCRTVLLFPFVTNQAGFDTGVAISNTSTDPFGTTPQAGTCTLNFYGASAPAAITTGSVASGTSYTALASTSAPGFQGYMIAVCNFQYAHGFAFISDVGARNLAMGYLALVIPDPGIGARPAANLGANSGGEQLVQ
ncbi:MAG TPA: hypothetical protein VG675_21555 [Bryobacteraceae bacterium]|nr:hypothetical protein [Bryobacteraceae bacterium]